MKIIGHRGAKGLAPENTLRAFEKALEHGVDEIELDVRVTKDGQTVLIHDPYVTDPAGSRVNIASHTLAELQKHKPDLATLEAAITTIDRRVPTYIEVKPGVPTSHTITTVRSFMNKGWLATDFRLGSYSQQTLRELHAALPDIEKIVIENWSGIRATRRARELGTKRISMLEYWLWPGFIRAVRRTGYQLYSFPGRRCFKQRIFTLFGLVGTSNNPRRARKWAKAGLTGVITDRPDLFQK